MHTWHPLPSALYSFAETTPGTILLETSRPGTTNISRLFMNPVRVLEARTAADVAALFVEIEEAVQRGNFAAGHFAYECGGCFEPAAALRPGRASDLLAWIGALPALLPLRSPYRYVPGCCAGCGKRCAGSFATLLHRQRRLVLINASTQRESRGFTHGLVPEMYTSSTSPSRFTSKQAKSQQLFILVLSLRSQLTTGHFYTARRVGTFFVFHRSYFFGWKTKTASAGLRHSR